LQHNVQLPQVLMGRFRQASRAAIKHALRSFNQRRGHSSTTGAQVRQARFGVPGLHCGQTRRAALAGSPSIVEPWSG